MPVNKPLGFHPSTCIHPGDEGQAHSPAEKESPSRIDVGGTNQLTTALPARGPYSLETPKFRSGCVIIQLRGG